jgi:hypothetical protein
MVTMVDVNGLPVAPIAPYKFQSNMHALQCNSRAKWTDTAGAWLEASQTLVCALSWTCPSLAVHESGHCHIVSHDTGDELRPRPALA